MTNPAWQEAYKNGMTHCVSYVLKGDDPTKPWRQNYFKNVKDAKLFEESVLAVGGRAIWSGMRPQFPQGK